MGRAYDPVSSFPAVRVKGPLLRLPVPPVRTEGVHTVVRRVSTVPDTHLDTVPDDPDRPSPLPRWVERIRSWSPSRSGPLRDVPTPARPRPLSSGFRRGRKSRGAVGSRRRSGSTGSHRSPCHRPFDLPPSTPSRLKERRRQKKEDETFRLGRTTLQKVRNERRPGLGGGLSISGHMCTRDPAARIHGYPSQNSQCVTCRVSHTGPDPPGDRRQDPSPS